MAKRSAGIPKTKTALYGSEIEKKIAAGLDPMKAAQAIADEHKIALGTATSALYRWRRTQGVPSSRARTHRDTPKDLQELLDDISRTQALLASQLKALETWARVQESSVEQRALDIIRAAAKT